MAAPLRQQRLLLEWLVMSGNSAVSDHDSGGLLYPTLQECAAAGWITLTPFGAGFNKASITDAGRKVIEDRRKATDRPSTGERRRAPIS